MNPRQVIVWLLLLSAPVAAQDAPARDAWRRLWKDPEKARSRQHRQVLLKAIGFDAAVLRGLIQTDTAYPPRKPGWHNRSHKVRAEDKTYDAEMLFRVPAGYDAAKSWPLLLIAHGQHGTGGSIAAHYQALLGESIDDYVLVSPTMPGPDGYNAKPYQERAYLDPLDWARRNLNIDDDRIYVSGYSQGGHGTWHLAVMYPHRFAAAVPMAGVPVFQTSLAAATIYLENIEHLPVWAIWGELDRQDDHWGNVDFSRLVDKRLKLLKNAHYRGTELAGAGHGQCWPREPKAFLKFLADHRRTAAPERFTRVFSLMHHNRGYYVEVLDPIREPIDLSKPIQIKVPGVRNSKPSQGEIYAAQRHYLVNRSLKFQVRRLGERNIVQVLTRDFRKARIHLVDGLVDLDKPVTLRMVPGAWRGRVQPSAACILEHYVRTRDQRLLVNNVVEIDRRGKVEVLYDPDQLPVE